MYLPSSVYITINTDIILRFAFNIEKSCKNMTEDTCINCPSSNLQELRVKGLKKFLSTLKRKEDGSGNNYS